MEADPRNRNEFKEEQNRSNAQWIKLYDVDTERHHTSEIMTWNL